MSSEPQKAGGIAPNPRKLRALTKLQALSIKLSDGTDYNLHDYILPGVTLDQVRQELSGIHGSLADAVIDERAR